MPEISPDAVTWTIRVKPGIYFADDPVFKGAKRELTAQDYVYSWKRLSTRRCAPRTRTSSRASSSGSTAAVERAKKTGKFDYDAEIEGLKATIATRSG